MKLAPDVDIQRVVLCSGKVFYDLFEERESRGNGEIYLMRVGAALSVPRARPYPGTEPLPERRNRLVPGRAEDQGAWTFVEANIEWVLDHLGANSRRPRYVGRPACASTAAGLMSKHTAELHAFLDEALTLQG